PIAPASSVNFTFPTNFNMLPVGEYTITAYSSYAGDFNAGNDTSTVTLLVGQPKISSFPYLETFDANEGYWLTGAGNASNTNRSFEYGSVPYLSGAQGNGNSFYLNMSGANG